MIRVLLQNLLVVMVLVFASCDHKNHETEKSSSHTFYVGTYTDYDSKGIYKYTLQQDGSLQYVGLAAASNNPSFLAMSSDNKTLLAVNETAIGGFGSLESYLINGDSLIKISQSTSGGAHPCFVSVNQSGDVLVANYSSGNVGLLHVNDKGELSKLLDVQQHEGTGVHSRQKGPHAHSAWFHPFDQRVISVDLGSNQLWFSRIDHELKKLLPATPQTLAMEAGAGPRHLDFHPNGQWIYVLNELNGSITFLAESGQHTYEKMQHISTLPPDYTQANTCADIHLSPDGKFVYASNRGHNSIAIFKVDTQTGQLTFVAHQPTHGDGPRNFSLSPGGSFILVANQHSNNIVSFKRDKSSGLLSYISEIESPTPVCILF